MTPLGPLNWPPHIGAKNQDRVGHMFSDSLNTYFLFINQRR